MRLIFTSYVSTKEYSNPAKWLKRIEGYTGILESLSQRHTVVGVERISYAGEWEQNGVHYYFINQKKKTVFFPFRIHRMVKRFRPDVVFIHGFIFPLQLIQLRMKLGRKVKIIVFHRAEKPFAGIKGFLQRIADHSVDAYLFASSEFGNEWKERGIITNPAKIHEVLHGSSVFKPGDKDSARSKLKITSRPIFLWVGRLNDNKDPLTVVKAFVSFLDVEPGARLYMIYHTEELFEKLKDLVQKDSKAKEAVRFVGKVPHEEMEDWYRASDFILSGSYYEGGGIAVAEAMSCGCIPIVTDIFSFRRMTGPGKCGFLFEAGNGKALLDLLINTRNIDLEIEREKTLQQFANELSFTAIAAKINNVINSLQ